MTVKRIASRFLALLPMLAIAVAAACGGSGGDSDDAPEAPAGESTATPTPPLQPGSGGNAGAGGAASSQTPVNSQLAPDRTPTPTATPEPVFPVEFEVDSTAHTVTSANPCGTPVSLAVLGGRVDTAIPTDPEVRSDREGEPGDKYVYLEFRALGVSGQCGGANVQDPIVRLEIDGLPALPGSMLNFIVRNGEGNDFVVVFVVPPDASEFRLLLGDPDETVAEIDLDIPTFDG